MVPKPGGSLELESIYVQISSLLLIHSFVGSLESRELAGSPNFQNEPSENSGLVDVLLGVVSNGLLYPPIFLPHPALNPLFVVVRDPQTKDDRPWLVPIRLGF